MGHFTCASVCVRESLFSLFDIARHVVTWQIAQQEALTWAARRSWFLTATMSGCGWVATAHLCAHDRAAVCTTRMLFAIQLVLRRNVPELHAPNSIVKGC